MAEFRSRISCDLLIAGFVGHLVIRCVRERGE